MLQVDMSSLHTALRGRAHKLHTPGPQAGTCREHTRQRVQCSASSRSRACR